ncbi:MFS transporter [Kitasatospora sp. NPDC093550]|uniref:MFS transporter n=1 Tax=Kitasatospora sp. NPDC093550 TaxID=3364089 RepID=UPI003818BA08
MIRAYAELLRLPGASAAAVPAALARLAGTMVPLTLLLTVVGAGHSLAAAGGVGAAYALGSAAGSPVLGRLMDRSGPTAVLRLTGPAVAAVLAATGLWAARAPIGLLFAAALAAGLGTAPVGASVRALWGRLTEDARLRRLAYSFESTFSELLFIAGPSIVTLLASLVGARSALLATALLLGAGAVGYAQAPAVRGIRPAVPVPAGAAGTAAGAAARSRRGAAATAVLVAIALTAALSSALAVAVTAVLRAQGSAAALAGTLVALQSVGSVIGGLVYGARTPRGTTLRRYLRLLVVLSAALATLPAAALAYRAGLPATPVLVLLAVLLALSGLPIAPAGAEEFQLIGEMTAQQKMTQAFAGVGSFIAIGGAAGSALAGVLADGLGPVAAMALPAALTLAALLVTLAARRAITAATDAGAGAPEHAAGAVPAT